MTRIDLHSRVGIDGVGGGGGVQSRMEFPVYIARLHTDGDSPGAN